MREGIERVIAELEKKKEAQKEIGNKTSDWQTTFHSAGTVKGYEDAITLLRKVIANETNSPDRTDGGGPDDAKRKVDQ